MICEFGIWGPGRWRPGGGEGRRGGEERGKLFLSILRPGRGHLRQGLKEQIEVPRQRSESEEKVFLG